VPRCGTAVSDLEVLHEDRPGHLWHIRYPFEDGQGHLTVATTRPETMLGDTAVAVNPADERYRPALGRKLVLPLIGRIIPVVADDFVDPKFGTGAVKVTPAHDPNDYAISQRHHLPRVVVIDEHARMTADAGQAYQGLDRYKAREAVVKALGEQGLLEKIEDYPLSLGTCQRCKSVIEPLLSTQWFLQMQPLAEPAIRAVEDGRVRVTPDNYKKIYLDWMYKIHDWCISRQLWWDMAFPRGIAMPAAKLSWRARRPRNAQVRERLSARGRGHARHLVQFRPLAFLPRWVGRMRPPTCSGSIPQSDDHGLRYPVFLGRAHDYVGSEVHE